MEICEFAFSQTGLRSLREHSKGQNWPVVYLINNDKPYRSESCRRFHNEETGLYLLGNLYVLNDFLAEISA